MVVDGTGQLVAERNVVNLGMVIGQRSVVGGKIEGIDYRAVAVSVRRGTVAGAQDLAKGEVCKEEQITGLLLCRRLQRVVVGIASVLKQVDVAVID